MGLILEILRYTIKHQPISIHTADEILIVLDQFLTQILQL